MTSPVLKRSAARIPAEVTSFIGREQELESIAALLSLDTCRLVTLTGPGGVGKTRLAWEAARRYGRNFRDGASLVPLASVSDPELVASTIASSLGIAERSDRPFTETLIEALQDSRALIVVDNFEQVDAAAPLLGDLLWGTDAITLLVTSRSPLRISGEHVLPVSPLGVPQSASPSPLAEVQRAPAVQLFVDRARAASGTFTLTADNAAAVASICRRLDGIPLAIELAASWTRFLPASAILTQLAANPLDFGGGPRNAPERHQTLRATIAWSYDLLPESERQLFDALGVFSGGWTLEAASAVTELRPSELLRSLAVLIDRGLIQPMPVTGGAPRFVMLETVREFAVDRLSATAAAAEIAARHSRHFLGLAESAKDEILGPDQAAWLARLDADLDNLRATFHRALAERDAETALRLGASLWRYWRQRGHSVEGRDAIERALTIDAPVDPMIRASAIYYLGNLALDLNEFAAAKRHFTESVALWHQLDDQDGIASSRNSLGIIAWSTGDYAAAASSFQQALDIWTAIDDIPGVIMAHHNLGRLAAKEDKHDLARFHHRQALEMRRERGDMDGVAYSLWALAASALLSGEPKGAESLLHEALPIFAQLGDRQGEAYVLHGLAQVAMHTESAETTLRRYHEVLILRQSLGERNGVIESCEEIASLLAEGGALESAVRLLGAAAALRKAISLAPWVAEQRGIDKTLALAQSTLTPTAFSAAWEGGRCLSFERMLAEALALTGQSPRTENPPILAFDLTRREREILALLSQRHTDPEIAARLFITTKTASNHVSSILGKLGVKNRREAAEFAAKHALT